MAAVPFCHGVLDSRLRGNDGGGERIARMGCDAPRRFVAMPPSPWALAQCFVRGWAGEGFASEPGVLGMTHGLGLLIVLSRLKKG